MAQNVRSKGWDARVILPGGRTLPADPLADPGIEPSINTLPRIHLPVPRSETWQGLNLTTEPTFDVFLEGDEQPIDELVKIRDRRQENATVLVGRGGVELLEEADVEFRSSRRHLAAQQVIQNQTPYDDDVDVPDSEVLEDQDMQNPTTQSELSSLLTTIADNYPLEAAGGGIRTLDTLFITEAEDASVSGGSVVNRSDASGGGDGTSAADGNGQTVQLGSGNSVTFSFNVDHVIPADDVGAQVRWKTDGASSHGREITINGETVEDVGSDISDFPNYFWRDVMDTQYSGPDLDPDDNPHTLKFTATPGSTDDLFVDCIAVYDEGGSRFTPSYNFDNSLTEGSDGGLYLDGPEPKSNAVEAIFDASLTAFQVIAGTATIAIDDDTGSGSAPSGGQKVQLRNGIDRSYEPTDGSEDNTESVTIDPFNSAGDRIQLKVTLSRWSENGTRDQTPREGYSSQTLTSYDLDADIRQESLLLDYRRSGSIEDILNDIAGDEFFWSYRVVDGTKTVTFSQPGQRTGDTEPQLIEADVTQDVESVFSVSVEGANKTVSGEQFSASTSFVNLTEDDIVPGSESVRDPDTGTQFVRGEDYEMDWSDGEIRITDDGDMTASNTYEVTYRAETRGSFTAADAPANPRVLNVDIPGVTSDRNAEQLAFVLVSDLKDPRWIGDITIPPSVTEFDVVEALPLDKLGLPSGASPFYIPEPPRQTPRGVEFRLESQPDQQRRVAQLKRQVSAVVRRTG